MPNLKIRVKHAANNYKMPRVASLKKLNLKLHQTAKLDSFWSGVLFTALHFL
jgi:hypothetical protein